MEKALTKYFWVFNLAIIALVAFFSATGTSGLIAGKLSGLLPQTSDSSENLKKRSSTIRSHVSIRNSDAILQRNIFDSTTGSLSAVEMLADNTFSEIDPNQTIMPCASGQTKLLVTVASDKNPDWSFANISNSQGKELVRIGDNVDGRVISAITWRSIILRNNTDECYLDMYGDTKIIKKSPKSTNKNNIEKDIVVDGEFERTVPRSLVDSALANPTKFAKSVRVRPYKKNGEVVGFRFRRIKKGSPLELLGAKKGDIIHAVNGVDLTSVDQALGAYQSLRTENHLTFKLTRKGKPIELNINIR